MKIVKAERYHLLIIDNRKGVGRGGVDTPTWQGYVEMEGEGG